MTTSESTKNTEPVSGSLGTFAGVFTPSILTILGIILFLRMGFVVGSAGLGRALIIIALANAISVLTSFSLSAVATNLKVKGGGDYYLISRTLGLEFGGSIGLVLFLAQSVSIAFYCIGFAEAISSFSPGLSALYTQMIAAGAVAFLFIFAWLGADWATKFQFVVMALLIAALISFFIGGFQHWDTATLASNWASPEDQMPFWILFAIFFPAVTGFTQGVSMSGDLKDPGKSLPLGTFLAVGISIVVYFAVALVFSASLPNSRLTANYNAMGTIAKFGFLIDAGVIAATLSSAMASFLGAPRILQALSSDRIFSFLTPFEKVHAPSGNPRRSVLLSAGIAFATIALGQLNLVARMVSMFFLISYGLLNYATYYEAKAASPSFRPRFKWFSPQLSLAGFLTCLVAMLAIDPKTGIAAIAVLFAIHQYLKHTSGPSRWADSARSYNLQQVRQHLLAAYKEPEHARDWRPGILVFTHDTERREPLLTFASWIEGGRGFLEAVQIVEGEGAVVRKMQQSRQKALTEIISQNNFSMFPLTVCAPDFSDAMGILIQSSGIGPLRPNTIVVNWFGESGKAIPGIAAINYVKNLRIMFRLGKNLVVLHSDQETWRRLLSVPQGEKRIDVWWQNDATSRLMLLYAHMMTLNPSWEKAHIRVLTKGTGVNLEKEKDNLKKTLEDVRIEAEGVVLESVDPEVIVEHSKNASLVFLPLSFKDNRIMDATGKSLSRFLPKLPVSALMLASQDIDLDAQPEEGAAAKMAAATDALKKAQEKAAVAEKDVEKERKKSDKLKVRLTEMEQKGKSGAIDLEKRNTLKNELETSENKLEKAFRRAAKARVKADDAARAAGEQPMDEKPSNIHSTDQDKPE